MIFRLRPPPEGGTGLRGPSRRGGSEKFLDIPVPCGNVGTPGVDPIGEEPEIVHILGNVKIEQLERFVGVFSTAGAEARGRHGNRGTQLFRVAGEEDRVVVLFEWESEEAFEAFKNDSSVKETMRSSGTVGPPEFTVLKKVGEFPS